MALPIAAALLAGLKAAGIGAATALGAGAANQIFQPAQQMPMVELPSMMSGNGLMGGSNQQNPYQISGLGALTMPGLGVNFGSAFINALKNKNKQYPTSGDMQKPKNELMDSWISPLDRIKNLTGY